MTTQKSPDGNRGQRSSSQKVYIKPVKRSRDRRFTAILVAFILIASFSLFPLSMMRSNLERQLQGTLLQIETLQAENTSLWDTILFLQSENDILKAENEAMLDILNTSVTVCSTSTFKSWMDYRAITSPSSKQYALQKEATTDKNYGFRLHGDFVMVAMGPQYGPVGAKYIIEFEDGKVLKVVVGDIKHQGCTSGDGSMLEFIVDRHVVPQFLKVSGDFNSVFKGSIQSIREVS